MLAAGRIVALVARRPAEASQGCVSASRSEQRGPEWDPGKDRRS